MRGDWGFKYNNNKQLIISICFILSYDKLLLSYIYFYNDAFFTLKSKIGLNQFWKCSLLTIGDISGSIN